MHISAWRFTFGDNEHPWDIPVTVMFKSFHLKSLRDRGMKNGKSLVCVKLGQIICGYMFAVMMCVVYFVYTLCFSYVLYNVL